MTDVVQFLWPPFLVAVCLVGIHTYFGILVLARKVIFVDLALAQIAALGATVAFMLGHSAQSMATYGYSLTFTVLAAVLLAFTRAWGTRVPQEALIGVIYVVAAATAILLIDRAPQGAEHLKQILTGNILTSGLNDVVVIVPLYAAVGLLHWLLRRHMTGAGSLAWEFVFYATFGIVVTSSVAIAGVLLVFSFLIIPAAIGVMFAETLSRQLTIGWIVGTFVSASGLAGSFVFDLPTGAAMVCAFGAALALAGALYPFLRGDRRGDALHDRNRALDWCCDFGGLGGAARGRAARRSATHRSRRMGNSIASHTLFHPRRSNDVRRCERTRGTLSQGGGAAQRNRTAQPHARRGARRLHRRAHFLVPEILWRNAQGRAICCR
jgi:ABC-type Mn2+/Zn2+ transport system permease subunit